MNHHKFPAEAFKIKLLMNKEIYAINETSFDQGSSI